MPNTQSPLLNRLTFLPMDSTSPANTMPRIGCLGLLNPRAILAAKRYNAERFIPRTKQSEEVTAAAQILTRTS